MRHAAILFAAVASASALAAPGVVYEPKDGPGAGKHIVFVTGDDEYRSEESMPQMAKILSQRHGFRCTVLFAIDPDTGAIDATRQDNIPGLEALADADLMVIFTRFRNLPDDQMKHIVNYTNAGRPILGVRTSTHAFRYPEDSPSPYRHLSWNSIEPKGGWGRVVLGETWISHYGGHNVEATRAYPAPGQENHPIARGCETLFGPSDVYEVTRLKGPDCTPIFLGQPLNGMTPEDTPNTDKPPLPVAWTKTFAGAEDKPARVFTTTMGHSYDFKDEGVRRMFVNAAYWCVGLEDAIPERADVAYVGDYDPSDIGFGTHKTGVMPEAHALD